MAVGNVASSLALQKEYVVPKLEKLALVGSRLWKHFKLNTKIKPVSNRPTRIPMQPLTAGKFRVGNFDGSDMGLGSGPQTVPGTISCVSFVQASQWTAQAEYDTDSDEKAIEDYVALLQSQQTETMGGYMDSLIQTDGSGTLDQIVAVNGNVLTVNNANFFQDNQDLDVYSNLLDQGGVMRGSVTVLSTDAINSQITLTALPPNGTVVGDRLLVSGSAGISNSSLFGLRYYLQAGNTGSWLNVQKSSYPGKFNVPNINAPGTLTQAVVRAVEAQMRLSIGIEKADQANVVAHCNVDMMAAWELLSITTQRIDYVNLRGDESADVLKRKQASTIAGREVIVNERARPGYIDFLGLENWFQIQSKALSLYDVKGQVVFPTYGIDGSVATSMLMYMVIMPQVCATQPHLNAFLSGVNIPRNYFGH